MTTLTSRNVSPEQAPTSDTTPNVFLLQAIEGACRRIPPVFPLKSYVAVNPFVGLSDLHFLEAAALLRRVAYGDILMPPDYYVKKIAEGALDQAALEAALAESDLSLPQPWAFALEPYFPQAELRVLEKNLQDLDPTHLPAPVQTWADYLDAAYGTEHALFIVEEISKWCSVYFDEGQSSWQMPWRHLSLFKAWRESALLDANPILNGWSRFRTTVQEANENPYLAIQEVLLRLEIPESMVEHFLYRNLCSISGWSSHAQYRVREKGMHHKSDSSLVELLAIRMTYDLALRNSSRESPVLVSQRSAARPTVPGSDLNVGWRESIHRAQLFNPQLELLPRYVAHLALEHAYQTRLVNQITQANRTVKESSPTRVIEPTLQAVFCIDVRSEVYRRALEAQSPGIETLGFAGFFGMPIEYLPLGDYRGTAQCPVLITPQYRISDSFSPLHRHQEYDFWRWMKLKRRLLYAWNAFKTSAISCFSFVETVGLWFGVELVRESLSVASHGAMSRGQVSSSCCEPSIHLQQPIYPFCNEIGIPLPDQIRLAEGALRGMGLIQDFARFVLICGHGSETRNNPYAAGLDCGACGGHAGDVNARVAASLLNSPEVRNALKKKGISIPSDTFFMAGLHNTTTDEVFIFLPEDLSTGDMPESVLLQLQEIQQWLKSASALARRERARGLGLHPESSLVDVNIQKRSRDWAQVRPEWGLAGNAAFIIAPRERTQPISLQGKAFLHNYKRERDPSGSILEFILTAPVVVTNWINLQYFASTVNNRLFGSGNKVLHNIVGTLGVWQGNGGDLQVGLPLQSLHDGTTWRHEPLRLTVLVEAPREAVIAVLEKHPQIRALVNNGWVHLAILENRGKDVVKLSALHARGIGEKFTPLLFSYSGGDQSRLTFHDNEWGMNLQ